MAWRNTFHTRTNRQMSRFGRSLGIFPFSAFGVHCIFQVSTASLAACSSRMRTPAAGRYSFLGPQKIMNLFADSADEQLALVVVSLAKVLVDDLHERGLEALRAKVSAAHVADHDFSPLF